MEQLDELEIIKNSLNSIESEENENSLQAPKVAKKKRIPSEKQLEVLKNAREKALIKAKEKQAQRKLEEDAIEKEVERRFQQYKKGLEEKVIRKAVSIKKKEIKRQAILDDISDDDTPMEKIKEIATKKNYPPAEPKSKYIFV